MPCGVAGSVGENSSLLTYQLLHQIQHRGEDTTKILSYDYRHYIEGGVGLVHGVFTQDKLSVLKGNYAIGQVRYPTVGKLDNDEEKLRDAPPLIDDEPCFLAVSHNGDMPRTTYESLRRVLEKDSYFETNSDLEITKKILSRGLKKNISDGLENEDIFKAVDFTMRRVPAAYAVVGIAAKGDRRKLFGFTDPQKIRPLVFGKNSKTQVFASETAAIDVLGKYLNEKFEIYELKGGEVIIAEEGKEPERRRLIEVEPKHCFFEYTYFARPDSTENGVYVRDVRYKLGWFLGKDWLLKRNNVELDLVDGIPNSGRIYDEGFSAATGISHVTVSYKNPASGRAFTRPQNIRDEVSKTKMNIHTPLVVEKRIGITEDSIVRAKNSINNNNDYRAQGVLEIHGFIGTPPLVEVCEWGIDMKDPNAFKARGKTVEEIAKLSGYDSLTYATKEELVEAIGLPANHLCMQCIGGHGPQFKDFIIYPEEPNF